MSTTEVKPALELDVLAPERQRILLRSSLHPEKKYYELHWESELGMEDVARLATLTKQVEPLTKEGQTLDPATAKLLDAWLDEALNIVFSTKLEPEVRAEMGYQPKWRIVEFFGEVCMNLSGDLQTAMANQEASPTPKAPKRPSRSTGAK